MQGGTFVADEVLAKHDEKYMPPAVAESLKRHGESREGLVTPAAATPQAAPPAGPGANTGS
jgi:cytochrome c-type biogenesis protein CcmE